MRTFSIALLMLFALECLSQFPALEWSYTFGSAGPDQIRDSYVDEDGNLFITGYFDGTVDFDPSAEEFFLTTEQAWGGFIVKMSPDRELIWAKAIKGSDITLCRQIQVGKTGIYVAGDFRGNTDFDPGASEYRISSESLGENNKDQFVVKLDDTGDFLWAHTFPTNLTLAPYLAIDSEDNVYMSGSFDQTVDFDPSENTASLTSAQDDVFLVKLDKDGDFQWVNQLGGSSNDYINSLLVDANNNVYSTGSFQRSADFDPGEGSFILETNGSPQTFIQKLNNEGQFIWARATTGPEGSRSEGEAIITDKAGNLYLGGNYRGILDANPGMDEYLLEESKETSDQGYVLKLTAEGDFEWARSVGVQQVDMASDEADNLYLYTLYSETLTLTISGEEKTYVSKGSFDYLLQQYESDGTLNWAVTAGSEAVELYGSVSTDSDGNIYLSGGFGETLEFELSENNFPNTNNVNAFVFKITECAEEQPIITLSQTNDELVSTTNITVSAYRWYDCLAGEFMEGENSDILVEPPLGTYALQVVYGSGCSHLSECISYEPPPLSTQGAGNIYIYPNPTSDFVFINVESGKPQVVSVRDISGRLINKVKIDGSKQVPVRLGKESGLYFVEVKGESDQLYRVFKQ